MFKQATIGAAAAAAIMAMVAGSPADAQVDSWYYCYSNDVPGTYVMVSYEVANDVVDYYSGIYCNMLDIDYASSYDRACYLEWQFPGSAWTIYDTVTDALYDLACSI